MALDPETRTQFLDTVRRFVRVVQCAFVRLNAGGCRNFAFPGGFRNGFVFFERDAARPFQAGNFDFSRISQSRKVNRNADQRD